MAASGNETIPFDFPDIDSESIAGRYHTYAYPEREDSRLNYEIIVPVDWMVIRTPEPTEIPEWGDAVEIGAFHRYTIPEDQESDLVGGLYLHVSRVPSKLSDAQAVDERVKLYESQKNFRILKTQQYEVGDRTLKDVLFSYDGPQGEELWCRITGFKVEDDTRKYFFGKKDLFYFMDISLSEETYREFGAEVLYVAKKSLTIS